MIKIKLRTKFLLFFLLVSVIPLLFFFFYLLFQLEDQVENDIKKELGMRSVRMSYLVGDYINERYRDVLLISQNPVIISSSSSQEQKTEELKKIQDVLETFDDLIVVTPEGVTDVSLNYNYRGEWKTKGWFKDALDKKSSISDAHLILGPPKIILEIASPVLNEKDEVLAVVIGQIDMNSLWQLLSRYNFGSTGRYSIINKYDRYIVHDVEENFNKKREIISNGSAATKIEAYNKFLEGLFFGEDNYWVMVTSQDSREAFAIIDEIKYQLFLVLFLGVLLSIVISAYLSGSISGPIERLSKAASLVSEGELSTKTEIESKNEIGDLARSFNQMTNNLSKAKTELLKSNRSLELKVQERTEGLKNISLELEDKVRKLEKIENIESIVQSITDGLILFDLKMNVSLINPIAKKILNVKNNKTDVEYVNSIVSDINIPLELERALKNKSIDHITHIRQIKLNEKYYEVFINKVKDIRQRVVGVLLVFHDINDLKEADQMKSDFVSVASHQLRTPLTSIKLFTEMLNSGQMGTFKKDQKKYLENIQESSERMIRLVNDLLNVCRIESGRLSINPEPLNFTNLISSIINEVKPLADKKGVKIKFIHPKNIKDIALDKNLIRQVFQNLIVNSLKYSLEKSGMIKVVISDKDIKYLQVAVSDNGIGIPEKVQKRIFEKFFRADNATKTDTSGTGLGLYVSKMIIKASNGKIWFESKTDKGTTFYVRIPWKGMKTKHGDRSFIG